MALSTRLLALRNSPILLKLPPYLSALCILVGISWLLILPLNEYSRETYVSENAILPGQVHTYFGGSEHNIFRAYRQEVWHISHQSDEDRSASLQRVMREFGLKTARQDYRWSVAGEDVGGTNVYGLLQGPRADATEAMVLIAAWRNFENEINYSGVALALTMARYFSRWSIWSKDILLLIPDDSVYGPEAWVSAYHGTTPSITPTRNISALPIKAGALQAAVALDYPAGPWGHRFDKLDILYDGINGALPNLDLLNTAVQVASGQMGIGCILHGLNTHSDSYVDRLRTVASGIKTQSLGHATGPHSAFMPYHIDAITLKTVGDGWHDEMTFGRTTESLFRSVNNLLEHLHQSFFFYILLNTSRFVSIGNYLPAAMILAGGLTITALSLWVRSGKAEDGAKDSRDEKELVKITSGEDVALIPKADLQTIERKMFLPAVLVLGVHLAGLLPLYLLTHVARAALPIAFHLITGATILLPFGLANLLATKASLQPAQMLQSFSLLLLGAVLSMLATLNFSLAFVIGILCSPLSFVRPLPQLPFFQPQTQPKDATKPKAFIPSLAIAISATVGYVAIAPPVVVYATNAYFRNDIGWMLVEMARGWTAQGVWTSGIVWGIWWPAWVLGGAVLFSGALRKR